MTPPEWRRLLRRRSVTDTATRPSQFHGCDKRWYLYRRGSVYSAGSISSQRLSRPPSNRRPALLVSWTDPFDSPLNSIFMLGGAPKAREVYSKGAPFNNALHGPKILSHGSFCGPHRLTQLPGINLDSVSVCKRQRRGSC